MWIYIHVDIALLFVHEPGSGLLSYGNYQKLGSSLISKEDYLSEVTEKKPKVLHNQSTLISELKEQTLASMLDLLKLADLSSVFWSHSCKSIKAHLNLAGSLMDKDLTDLMQDRY